MTCSVRLIVIALSLVVSIVFSLETGSTSSPVTGVCAAQDTIRSPTVMMSVPKAACQTICDNFLNTASPTAWVFECRFTAGNSEIILTKGRSPIGPVKNIVGDCITQDTIRGGAIYPSGTQKQCQQLCNDYLASADPNAAVSDCRFLVSDKPEMILTKRRDPISQTKTVVGVCIPQDTIRGSVVSMSMLKATCQVICDDFLNSAAPAAWVFDCRFIAGNPEIILTKGRSPIGPVKNIVGDCITQDMVRGGTTYPSGTQEQCQQLCDDFLKSASPTATVYDCRFHVEGKPEVVLVKGQKALQQ